MAESEGVESGRRAFLRWLSLSGVGLASGAVPVVLGSGWSAAGAGLADVTVLRHVTVIDGTGARPRRDATVVLVGDRIAGVAGHGEIPLAAGVRMVDLRGKFVIPGLWDMHTHGLFLDTIYPPLYIVNGVTGIREMWGYPEVRAVRERIERGEVLGPRVVMASGIVDGPVTLLGPPVITVGTEAQARAVVGQEKASGADFMKIYSYLSRGLLAAIADESRRQGIPFAGHLPYRVSLGVASDLGQRSVEHLFGVPVATSRDEESYRRIIADTPIDPAHPRAFFDTMREVERQAIASYDPARAAAVFQRLVRNGSWQSPTLTVNFVMSRPAGSFDDDPRLWMFVPAWIRNLWASRHSLFAPVTPEQIVQQREFMRARLRLVAAMYDAGVGMISGTDSLNPYCYPGSGTHDELALLVEAGLTPMQALRTATLDSARYLGLEPSMGTVTRGKVADLVILDANPLADIDNIRKVHAVVTRGRLITSRQRQKILAEVEKAAQDSTPPAATALPRLAAGCC